jgi:hypothetical protein
LAKRDVDIIFCAVRFLFFKSLQKSTNDFNFRVNPKPMNKKYYSFWLRFSFFLVVFAVAFFLVMFILDKNPVQNFRMLLIKIGVLATLSSLFYNIFLESNAEMLD